MSVAKVRELMDEGKSAKEIMEETSLTKSTVYTYMSNIRKESESGKPEKNEVKTVTSENKKGSKVVSENTVSTNGKNKNEEIERLKAIHQVEIEKLNGVIEELRKTTGEAGDKVSSLQSANQKLKEKLNRSNSNTTTDSEDRKKLRDEINSLKSAKEQLGDEVNSLREELEQNIKYAEELHERNNMMVGLYDKAEEKYDLAYKLLSLEKQII